MRLALALIALIASPTLADEWRRYENQLYSYAIDIPPGFLWRGEASNGDGQDFTTPTLTLSVRALPTPDGFAAAIGDWKEWEVSQGWNLVFEMTAPSRAEASARRSGWLMEMRAIDLCRTAYVQFQLEYAIADVGRMANIIERLASSLERTRPC